MIQPDTVLSCVIFELLDKLAALCPDDAMRLRGLADEVIEIVEPEVDNEIRCDVECGGMSMSYTIEPVA